MQLFMELAHLGRCFHGMPVHESVAEAASEDGAQYGGGKPGRKDSKDIQLCGGQFHPFFERACMFSRILRAVFFINSASLPACFGSAAS